MVRREADEERQYELPFASCTTPAGESPVPVSVRLGVVLFSIGFVS